MPLMPIRLAQQHATSGRRPGRAGWTGQAGTGTRPWGAAAMEAEDELVDMVGQVLGADAVMGAQQPSLEVGEGPMDARQLLGGVLRVADHGWPVLAAVAQGPERGPAIGQDRAARRDRLLGEAGEG